MSRYQKSKELGDAHESPVSSRSCFHSPSRSLRRDCRRTARGCGEFLCATGVHDALKSAAPAVGAEPESTMQDDSAAMSFALSRVWFQQGALPDSVRRGVRKLQLAFFGSSAAARASSQKHHVSIATILSVTGSRSSLGCSTRRFRPLRVSHTRCETAAQVRDTPSHLRVITGVRNWLKPLPARKPVRCLRTTDQTQRKQPGEQRNAGDVGQDRKPSARHFQSAFAGYNSYFCSDCALRVVLAQRHFPWRFVVPVGDIPWCPNGGPWQSIQNTATSRRVSCAHVLALFTCAAATPARSRDISWGVACVYRKPYPRWWDDRIV
jgi:hypothetical protein